MSLHKNTTNESLKPIDVLKLIGTGALIGAVVLAPGLAKLAYPILQDYRRQKRQKEFALGNTWQLRRNLRYLAQQKLVEIKDDGINTVVSITEKGRRKILSYKLHEIGPLTGVKWDGKWRIIIYDVSNNKRLLRDSFRRSIKSLGLLAVQKSVYVTPWACQEQVAFLREYYGVGNEILYLVVDKLENDEPYKKYFGLT